MLDACPQSFVFEDLNLIKFTSLSNSTVAFCQCYKFVIHGSNHIHH